MSTGSKTQARGEVGLRTNFERLNIGLTVEQGNAIMLVKSVLNV
jgi:hypothetical protein